MPRRIVKAYRDAYSGLPPAAWLLAMVEFVNRSGTMVLFFMTLYLTRKLGFSIQQAGIAMSCYGLGSLLGAWLGGWLCDPIGAFNVQKLSLVFTGGTIISIQFLHSFEAIAVMMALFGVVGEALHPANATAMSQVCPPQSRTRGFSLNRLAVNLGVTIGPVLGGYLAMSDYAYLFWVDGLTSLAAALVFIIFVDKNLATTRPEESTPSGDQRAPWRDRAFLVALVLIFWVGVVFVQLLSTFPLYLRTVYGFVENRIGQLLAINTIIIILFEMVLMHRLQRVKPIRVVGYGALFICSGFALMPLGRGFFFAGVTVVVWTIGEMLSIPMMTTMISDRAGKANIGPYMGAFSLAFALALTLGPALGSWVYKGFGPETLWIGCGALGVLLWVGFSVLGRWWDASSLSSAERIAS